MLAKFVATGSYVPGRAITNAEMVQFPKAALPLIEQKTGIQRRHHAEPSECTSDLAVAAARRCLDCAGAVPTELDAIVVSTSSPDRIHPPTATRVQHLIRADNAFAFDVNAVCSGSLYAIHIADGLIRGGLCRNVLVIAAELYSRFLNPKDFSTYPYFGDGAGAVLMRRDGEGHSVIGSVLHTDGSGEHLIQVPAGGTLLPAAAVVDPAQFYFSMRGKEVFEFATTKGAQVIQELASTFGVRLSDIACVVPHQANINIIHNIAERLGMPASRFYTNLERYGNTASASVLIALDEALKAHRVRPGSYIVLAAFGGGLTWGATLIYTRENQ